MSSRSNHNTIILKYLINFLKFWRSFGQGMNTALKMTIWKRYVQPSFAGEYSFLTYLFTPLPLYPLPPKNRHNLIHFLGGGLGRACTYCVPYRTKRCTGHGALMLYIASVPLELTLDLPVNIVIMKVMDGFSVGKILASLRNPELYLMKLRQNNGINTGDNNFSSNFAQAKPNSTQNTLNTLALANQLEMNQIASMDRSIYIKNLLGLPQTLGQLLQNIQNRNNPITGNTLLLDNLNQELIKNQKVLSQIFEEGEIAANGALNQQVQQAAANVQKDAVMLFFSGMIQMPAISDMILKNSKQAVASLIIAMASASKGGMSGDQIRETLSILNSCVTLAESGNPAQTLKSLMLLYLPWLPLNEGVGFDLEVEAPDGENESVDSKLTVLIQTKNYGNVKGVFTLTTSNSVDIYIICSEDFPKRTLQKSLMEESSSHAMNTTIDVEAVEPKSKEPNETREAKVNLSATNEMNPYLLLMAHAFIRNTIFIDSNGITEDSDT